jgi:hypothetical protein
MLIMSREMNLSSTKRKESTNTTNTMSTTNITSITSIMNTMQIDEESEKIGLKESGVTSILRSPFDLFS